LLNPDFWPGRKTSVFALVRKTHSGLSMAPDYQAGRSSLFWFQRFSFMTVTATLNEGSHKGAPGPGIRRNSTIQILQGSIMKAITFDQFGAADVLKIGEVPEPALRTHDLLVVLAPQALTAPT